MRLAPGVNENSSKIYDSNNRKLNSLAFDSRRQLSEMLSKPIDKADKRALLLKELDKDELALSIFLILERMAKLQEILEGAEIGFTSECNIKDLVDHIIESGDTEEFMNNFPTEGYSVMRFLLGEFFTGETVGAYELRIHLDSRKDIPRISLNANIGINYVSNSTLEKLFGDLNIPVTLSDGHEMTKVYENEASKVFSDR